MATPDEVSVLAEQVAVLRSEVAALWRDRLAVGEVRCRRLYVFNEDGEVRIALGFGANGEASIWVGNADDAQVELVAGFSGARVSLNRDDALAWQANVHEDGTVTAGVPVPWAAPAPQPVEPVGCGPSGPAVLAALSEDPQSPRAVAAATGAALSTVQATLVRLLAAGLARQVPGGWVRDRPTDRPTGQTARVGPA